MVYDEAALSKYRGLLDSGEPFRSRTCRYCSSGNTAVKHINSKKKPKSPWDFWNSIVCSPTASHTRAEGRKRTPMYVVGPMVDQSELPFRLLCRRYGATLAYTPMFHAKSFAQSAHYRQRYFSTTTFPPHSAMESGGNVAANDSTSNDGALDNDHPLFAQFCGNDPETVLAAARHVEDYCEAVDFNIGCPQGIARRGHYGSFLMEDWELLHNILHALAVELRVPVTAKMRIFDDEALTLKYAEMLRDTGIYVLCVHGRTRENKGQQQQPADLRMIRRVHEHLRGSIPIIANGNVLTFEDVPRNLAITGCEGYMCAEPLLWDPKLFAPLASSSTAEFAPNITDSTLSTSPAPSTVRSGRLFAESRPTRLKALATASEYLELVRRFPVDIGFVKAHFFKMLYHSYEMHPAHQQWLANFSINGSNVGNDVVENCATSHCGEQRETTVVGHHIFTAALDALTDHLHSLQKAELSLEHDGPQPKRQRELKVGEEGKERQQLKNGRRVDGLTDTFADDETLGIDFLM
ncbi:tRNA-dihydrouridine synthase 1 [Trypanosoma brucei equiperdum]|uniref:tRNA-dihydrouridine(16/17) synthase [NAD(P)(+)] n=1 Tax=Trypanosoma brucei equiperdum TaxID=630700 RepID=A0A3L6L8P3_9TRYP|nr:tRNA-dihydrouridine synthase 1 [Trypanosoma brucei equiperdum]